ncbi:hypothetical protein D9756_007929 [Leucocoprinus leucothites]|uniref:Mitochondrial chaperone BCS1 n=1 Tax=Leucocoprinus leucothites TaxID=201217 RepID=A0A8H5D421_9AGAR|nr:hypothetical protein D9756_007929 [Leucoagaricus leucothites]
MPLTRLCVSSLSTNRPFAHLLTLRARYIAAADTIVIIVHATAAGFEPCPLSAAEKRFFTRTSLCRMTQALMYMEDIAASVTLKVQYLALERPPHATSAASSKPSPSTVQWRYPPLPFDLPGPGVPGAGGSIPNSQTAPLQPAPVSSAPSSASSHSRHHPPRAERPVSPTDMWNTDRPPQTRIATPSPVLNRSASLSPMSAVQEAPPPLASRSQIRPYERLRYKAGSVRGNAEENVREVPPPPWLNPSVPVSTDSPFPALGWHSASDARSKPSPVPPPLGHSSMTMSPSSTDESLFNPLKLLEKINFLDVDRRAKKQPRSELGRFFMNPDSVKQEIADSLAREFDEYCRSKRPMQPSAKFFIRTEAAVLGRAVFHSREATLHILTNPDGLVMCPYHTDIVKDYKIDGASNSRRGTYADSRNRRELGTLDCGCSEDDVILEMMLRKLTVFQNPTTGQASTMRGDFLNPKDRAFVCMLFRNWTGLSTEVMFKFDDRGKGPRTYEDLLKAQISGLQNRLAWVETTRRQNELIRGGAYLMVGGSGNTSLSKNDMFVDARPWLDSLLNEDVCHAEWALGPMHVSHSLRGFSDTDRLVQSRMNPALMHGSLGAGAGATASGGGMFDFSSSITRIFGLSMFASFFTGDGSGLGGNSMKLIVLGMLVEFGRRFVQWVIERFRLREWFYCLMDFFGLTRVYNPEYSITAEFNEGDPAYDWIINFIVYLFYTQEKVWRRARDFRVSAKSSQRRWAISTANDSQIIESAEYVPTYDLPQLFRWKPYWIEIKRTKGQAPSASPFGPAGGGTGASIFLTAIFLDICVDDVKWNRIYTLDMSVLSKLVETAKKQYFEVSRPHVIVHAVSAHSYGPKFLWNNVKRKPRRPLSSIILPGATLDELIADIRDFLKMEDWYMSAGIPHRRGYLLYGPPGTGKKSSGSSGGRHNLMDNNSVDDTFLEQAVSSVPKGSILLIEDIDCAFSREDDEDEGLNAGYPPYPGGLVMGRNQRRPQRRSAVTLSGLLNILDGVGSEEGKIFFATTNYVDSLDAALMRPGRIDRKVEYKLATQQQARALFNRFYPINHVTPESLLNLEKPATDEQKAAALEKLTKEFTASVPEHEFSTAELQGFLLSCKMMPEKAAREVADWVADERRQKREKQERIEAKKRKQVERAEKAEVEKFQSTLARIGGGGLGSVQVNGIGARKPSDIPPPPTVASQVNGSGPGAPPTVAAQVNGMKTPAVNGSDSDKAGANVDASEGEAAQAV